MKKTFVILLLYHKLNKMPRLSPAALQQMYAQTEKQSQVAKQEGILSVGDSIAQEYTQTLIQNGERPEISAEMAFQEAQRAEKDLTAQEWNVIIVLDRSGSFEDEYEGGIVTEVLTRFAAICKQFDSDGLLECYSFADGKYACVKRNPITPQNYYNYVETEFRGEGFYGTQYAPFIRQITRDHAYPANGLPTFVLVLTDGNNDADAKGAAEQAIIDASPYPIFWFFVGLDSRYQNGGIMTEEELQKNFPTLSRLDDLPSDANEFDRCKAMNPNAPTRIRRIDNADAMGLKGREAFSKQEVLNNLFKEAPRWLYEAKALGIVRASTPAPQSQPPTYPQQTQPAYGQQQYYSGQPSQQQGYQTQGGQGQSGGFPSAPPAPPMPAPTRQAPQLQPGGYNQQQIPMGTPVGEANRWSAPVDSQQYGYTQQPPQQFTPNGQYTQPQAYNKYSQTTPGYAGSSQQQPLKQQSFTQSMKSAFGFK